MRNLLIIPMSLITIGLLTAAIDGKPLLYIPFGILCIIICEAILHQKEKPKIKEKPKTNFNFDETENVLEIKINGKWRRIHKHHLYEWLDDDQVASMKQLEQWMKEQQPKSKEEKENVLKQYENSKSQIVETRLVKR